MTGTVEFDFRSNIWLFNGELRSGDDAGSLVLKHRDLAQVKATDLVRALRKARRYELEPDSVFVDTAPDQYYWPDDTVVENISFELNANDDLIVKLGFAGSDHVKDDAHFGAVLSRLIGPFLRRHRSQLTAWRADTDAPPGPYFHTIELAIPTRAKSLLDLFAIADSLETLLDAAGAGQLTRDTAHDLLLGGRADLLVGLPESSWLDVKAQHYDLSTPHGKISLAEAVSRFCNAEDGGIVVVGMDTKKLAGGEIIKSLRPVPLDPLTVRRYRQNIENRLFPFPTGLAIDAVETSQGHGLVVVSIPPQDEEYKPFLVHGAIVDGKIQGAYISIVRRSGEDSIPITAQQIHSTLAAGRALLRRGELPTSRD